MHPSLLCLTAYLLGSLSFAVLISRLFNLPDPRSYGSNNPGATNVLRSGKKSAAALTLLFDCLKGVLAVGSAQLLFPENHPLIALVALLVFLGHLFPVFFRFQGGKGVATALGILLILNIWLGLATLFTWLIIAKFGKISSLAALIAAVLAPVYAYFIYSWIDKQPLQPYLPLIFVISTLLIWRHKKNIAQLLQGQESRIHSNTSSTEP